MAFRHKKRERQVNAELNITAFMNLMVVLVPFLLITAVFSQVSILNLNLPGTAAAPETPDKPQKALEVVVRKDKLELIERASGSLKVIPNITSGHDFKALNDALKVVKANAEFAEMTNILLLMEEETPYDLIIKTMDAVRMAEQTAVDARGNESKVYAELFPDISIGNAPILDGTSS